MLLIRFLKLFYATNYKNTKIYTSNPNKVIYINYKFGLNL